MGLAVLRSETCIPNELNFSIGLVGAMLMRYSDDAMPCSKAVNVTSHNWRGDWNTPCFDKYYLKRFDAAAVRCEERWYVMMPWVGASRWWSSLGLLWLLVVSSGGFSVTFSFAAQVMSGHHRRRHPRWHADGVPMQTGALDFHQLS